MMSETTALQFSATTTYDLPSDNSSHYTAPAIIDLTNISSTTYSISEYFDTNNTCRYIVNYNNDHPDQLINDIALQLPDSLLCYSASLINVLYHQLHDIPTNNQLDCLQDSKHKFNIFILGDTSYGACCIDTVNTAHLSHHALIIHYDMACFSGVSDQYNILYVFGKKQLEMDKLTEQLITHRDSQADAIKYTVIFFDQCYSHYIHLLTQQLHSRNILYNDQLSTDNTTKSQYIVATIESQPSTLQSNQYYITGYLYTLPSHTTIDQCECIWIGSNDCALYINLLLNYNSSTFYTYCTVDNTIQCGRTNISRLLARRYYLIEKAKNCTRIGIIIASVSMTHYYDILQSIKSLLRKHNKKYYVINIGKINESKLGNYSNFIDIYVIISCPLQCIIDTKQFYHDIITPYELQLSLDSNIQWTGKYNTAASVVLDTGTVQHNIDTDGMSEYNMDGMRYDSVTQRMKSIHINDDHDVGDNQSTSLSYDSDTHLTTHNNHTNLPDTVNILHERHYHGLQRRRGLDAAAHVEMGLTGIASHYDKETR